MMHAAQAAVRAYTPLSEREAADRAQILRYLAQGNDALTREDSIAHFTASAWVTDPARELVLMAFHNIYGAWAWVGGHADGNADLAAVAAKEAQEETGIRALRPLLPRPVSLEVLTVKAHVRRGVQVSAHLHFNLTYLFEADPAAPLAVKADENSAVGWRTAAQTIADCNEPEMIPIYEKLLLRMHEV